MNLKRLLVVMLFRLLGSQLYGGGSTSANEARLLVRSTNQVEARVAADSIHERQQFDSALVDPKTKADPRRPGESPIRDRFAIVLDPRTKAAERHPSGSTSWPVV